MPNANSTTQLAAVFLEILKVQVLHVVFKYSTILRTIKWNWDTAVDYVCLIAALVFSLAAAHSLTLSIHLKPLQCLSCRSETTSSGQTEWVTLVSAPQTKVAFNLLRSLCPLPSLCSICLRAGKSEVWYTADLILLPRQRSSKATPSHFLSSSEPREPCRSRGPFWARLLSSLSVVALMLSKSNARFGVEWWERDEGDLDLWRERIGGRGGGRGGGEGGVGFEGIVLLLGILKPPPPPLPLSLSLDLFLSLPEEEEADLKKRDNQTVEI